MKPWEYLLASVCLALAGLATGCAIAKAGDTRDLLKIAAVADSGARDAARTREAVVLLRGVAADDARRQDSLLHVNAQLDAKLRSALRAVPVVPAMAPDTCLPWVRRAAGLDSALTVATAEIAGFPAILAAGQAEARHLQAAADTGAAGLQRSVTRFDTVRVQTEKLVSPVATRLAVEGALRYTPGLWWPTGEVGLRAAGLLFAGAQVHPEGGALTVRVVVEVRKAIRLF